MKKQGKVKHLFPGGNTTKGFYSYYQYILGQQEAKRIICIKGGPGVGKSTFMKNIGKEMIANGYDVEYMHCSSDPNSLDGLVIPSIKVALLDGTAPHVVDPKNPGAVDEILHLGDYWDEEGISENKEQILEVNKTVGKLFSRAYKYLAASKKIYNDITDIHEEALNAAGVNIEAEKIISSHLASKPIGKDIGKVRKLFASAITPDGLINFLDNIITDYNIVYTVKGEPGTGTEKVLLKVMDAAISRGFNIEAFYCPIEPDKKIEHLLIPELSIAIVTTNKYHGIKIENTKIINMNDYLDDAIIQKNKEALDYNRETFDGLLKQAIVTINKAKELHDYMETFYIPHMDFESIQFCCENTIDRIIAYAKEYENKRG